MDYYGQSSAATVTTGRSPTWYEAVNSEFFYDKNQIQDMNSNNHHMYATSGVAAATTHHSVNNVVHEQPLTILTTAEQTHTNIDYYQRPIPMHFSSDANYLQTAVPSLTPPSSSPSTLLSSSSSTSYVNGDGNALVTYAPCQGPRPWNFAQCYGFYGQPACSLLNIIDMEDFMWVLCNKIASTANCINKLYATTRTTAHNNRFDMRSKPYFLSGNINKCRLMCVVLILLQFWIYQKIRVRAKLLHKMYIRWSACFKLLSI